MVPGTWRVWEFLGKLSVSSQGNSSVVYFAALQEAVTCINTTTKADKNSGRPGSSTMAALAAWVAMGDPNPAELASAMPTSQDQE